MTRSFLVVGLVGLVGIVGCKRDLLHGDPDSGGETAARAVTTATARVNLSLAGQPNILPVHDGSAIFIADGTKVPDLKAPAGIASLNNVDYIISDSISNKVLIVRATGTPTLSITVFGNGAAGFADGSPSTASFNHPAGLAVGKDGTIYIADEGNNRIRTISPDRTTVSTLAGTGVAGFADGLGNVAKLNQPNGISVDAAGVVYIADMGNNMIRRITDGNHVTRWAGQLAPGYKDDTGSHAAYNAPTDITITNSGAAFVTDRGNNRIRKIAGGIVTTYAGNGSATRVDGTGLGAGFNGPEGLSADSSGNLYVAESGSASVRWITTAGVVKTLVGGIGRGKSGGVDGAAEFTHPGHISVGPTGAIFLTDPGAAWVSEVSFGNATVILATNVPNMNGGGGLAVAPDETLYTSTPGGLIEKINPVTGATAVLVGGVNPGSHIICDPSGNVIALRNSQVLRISPSGAVTTIANLGEAADNPNFDNAGNLYFTSTVSPETILKLTPGGTVTRIGAPPVPFYTLMPDGHGLGWFKQTGPVWSNFAVDRSTGNFYVGTPETVYQLTADGSSIRQVHGGVSEGTPVVPDGQELKFFDGTVLTSHTLYDDVWFFATGYACTPAGILFMTNTGFDAGFTPPNTNRSYNIHRTFLTGPFGAIFVGDPGTEDDFGPDSAGSTGSTRIGAPFSPVLSVDGRTIYFLTLAPNGTNIHKVSTSAL